MKDYMLGGVTATLKNAEYEFTTDYRPQWNATFAKIKVVSQDGSNVEMNNLIYEIGNADTDPIIYDLLKDKVDNFLEECEI